MDLLSFSFGTVLVTDAIYLRGPRKRIWSQLLMIDNWITLGHPYDLICWSNLDYFSERQPATVRFRHWINVVVQDDFLGTAFTEGDGRDIRVDNCAHAYRPDLNPKPIEPKGE